MLAHEAAHARRRDPLRRLAAADALFYLPLARWWSRRQAETAELRAYRAPVGYAGRRAIAARCSRSRKPAPPRAQLLGDDLPARRPSAAVVSVPIAGPIAAVWLAMCLGQAALA